MDVVNWREINHPIDYDDEELMQIGLQSLASRRLNQAVKNGTLVRADRCQVCNKQCKTHGHHYKGHRFYFDVWWVCQRCNNALKGRHDGSLSLEGAKRIIIGRYFKRRAHYELWRNNQDAACICGHVDKVANMVVVYENYEDALFLCAYCAQQVMSVTSVV